MASQEFQDKVSVFPVEWANDVNDLVYDVFGAVKTAAGARAALGIASMALQAATAVAITGGALNGVTIGGVAAGAGTFTTLKASGTPSVGVDVVNLTYLNTRFATLSSLATMAPGAVAFTGGSAANLALSGGTLNSCVIGGSSPAAGTFTTLAAGTPIAVSSGGTGAGSFTGKYLVYVASPSPHFESLATVPYSDLSGVGTMTLQNANNVAITGGAINGVTLGGSVVYSGLGTVATQNSNNVNITGGTISGVTLSGVTQALGKQLITAATTADQTKDVFFCTANSADYIVDLPQPNVVTRPMFFKKLGAFRVDLRAPSGKFIDGAGVHNMFQDQESVILISDGTNFFTF